MVITKFNPGDYVVTNEGLRGYVIQQIEESDGYAIRLTSGYTIVNENEIQKDYLMEEIQ